MRRMKMGSLGLALLCLALFVSSTDAANAIPIDAIEIVAPGAPIESPPSPTTPYASPPPAADPVPPPPPTTPAPVVDPGSGNTSTSEPVIYWDQFYNLFGDKNVKFPGQPAGSNVELGLDNTTGSGFRSKFPFLYGHLSMKIKLPAGNSAGTVTCFYMASVFTKWSELDFEFLGNVTDEPYILQTNVFSEGKGEREQRIYLWFDPAADYHEYGILWNEKLILFLVDDVVIRVFHNVQEELGVPYLTYQPMYIYSTIWDGSTWATRGGADKADWSQQPFIASYKDFDILKACNVKGENDNEVNLCNEQLTTASYNEPALQTLTQKQIDDLKRVKYNYIIYDYCSDYERFNVTPVECALNWPF